jgi:hypothetical protein
MQISAACWVLNGKKVEKGSVESTHKVTTSHYHTKHCHAAVVSLGIPVKVFDENQGPAPSSVPVPGG